MAVHELTHRQLGALASDKDFGFKTTQSLQPLREIIGQDRAVGALEFGLAIRSLGYNIFVAGYPGTGRRSVVTRFLAERTGREPSPPDWCYVHNFRQADQPVALQFDPGLGLRFAADVQKLIVELRHDVRKAFEGEQYDQRKNEVAVQARHQRDALQQRIGERLRTQGLAVQQTPVGIGLVPLNDKGEPMSREDFAALPEERQQTIQQQQETAQAHLESLARQLRQLDAELRERVRDLDAEITRKVAEVHFKELCHRYEKFAGACDYLKELLEDVVRSVELFREGAEPQEQGLPPFLAAQAAEKREGKFDRYKVNVFVSNAPHGGAPVVYEPNPTHPNLFGRIERRYVLGAMVTDFAMLKPGALHRANGGYLVLSALDLLTRPGSWDTLKRAIESSCVQMEDLFTSLGYAYGETLRPEPIPLQAKIILYGNPLVYHLLYMLDEDFRNLFRVKAEFGLDMNRSGRSLRQLAAFVARQAEEHQLLPFEPAAVAAVADYASRLVEDREKISTQFTRVTDVLSEADHWAREAREKTVSARSVQRAIKERTLRSNLIEEKLQEAVRRGSLFIDARGRRTGQVNGLVIHQLGDYDFGLPVRVTAAVHLGTAGVVHIERRAELSGPIHTKGVEILAGLLGERFCQDRPLALSASLTFEQSYGGVEGDSASAAEYFALLSALADAPVNQSIAVTGSINQKGDLQPIGGVSKKVEGFFDICRIKGLTGRQGVLIPRANVKNLVLRRDVVQAVSRKKFHVWSADTVDDGIELLTGLRAGRRNKRGQWTPGSIGQKADARLQGYAEKAKAFAAEAAPKGDKNKTKKGAAAARTRRVGRPTAQARRK